MSQGFDVPILFIIFNRPNQTAITFNTIRNMRPTRLYVAADGARSNHQSDNINCAKCREIIREMIDWDCEVAYLLQEKNLGCKLAVSSAITWFFEQVEMGIILEDDCLAEQSFFNFCKTMLIKYQFDEQFMHIGGTNFQPDNMMSQQSYYFSRIPHIWGWATWRRAWDQYDAGINDFSASKLKTIFHRFHFPLKSFHYWNHVLSQVQQNKLDTWDYQWTYSIWKNNGLVITPEVNMISNIGFDNTATHTTITESPYANMPTFRLETIIHPNTTQVDTIKDTFILKKWYTKKTFYQKIVTIVKKTLLVKKRQ